MKYYLSLYSDSRVEGVYSNLEDRKDLKMVEVNQELAKLAASTLTFSDFRWENNSLVLDKIDLSSNQHITATLIIDEILSEGTL